MATTDPRHLVDGVATRGASPAPSCASSTSDEAAQPLLCAEERQQLRAAETRLLYENVTTGAAASAAIAALLAYAQSDELAPPIVVTWLLFMIAVSAIRLVIAQRYWRASPSDAEHGRWNTAFVIGTTLAAVGWAAAAIALFPPNQPTEEIFVVFVIGGMMLGSASLLAARPEAFLSFLLPIGVVTSARLALQGDQDHLLMGALGLIFTVVTVITTWRFHIAIESSFKLRFANQALIARLQKAKDETDAVNRELERRVRERTAQLMEADQRKDEFLATLAHELRNPLAPIRFALESLKGDAPSDVAARAREVIERQVRQLVRLVDDLLDVSRITADKIQLRRGPHDVGRLMTTAVESVAPLAAAAGHTLEVRLPDTPLCVEGDGARLVQVFANVLNNAVKFTPRDGRICFSAAPHSDMVVLRVTDTGVGIAEDMLPRVFDMFHQAEPVLERSKGGLGIGLTLARRLVEMHDGQIAVRSAGISEGTEVEIRLPLSTASPATLAGATEQPLSPSRRTLRVLIVEDNVDAAEMMDLAISNLGHITRMAHDGDAALTVAAEFKPDVIFLDIGLPVVNGYEIARALRALPDFDRVHIAAVTGWGQDEDRRRARDAGCDTHFTKPLAPSALDELLSRLAQQDSEDEGTVSTPRTRHADASGAF